jgi:hypothetical protein
MNTSTVYCTCSAAGPHVIGAMNMELKLPPSVPVYKPTDHFMVKSEDATTCIAEFPRFGEYHFTLNHTFYKHEPVRPIWAAYPL